MRSKDHLTLPDPVSSTGLLSVDITHLHLGASPVDTRELHAETLLVHSPASRGPAPRKTWDDVAKTWMEKADPNGNSSRNRQTNDWMEVHGFIQHCLSSTVTPYCIYYGFTLNKKIIFSGRPSSTMNPYAFSYALDPPNTASNPTARPQRQARWLLGTAPDRLGG